MQAIISFQQHSLRGHGKHGPDLSFFFRKYCLRPHIVQGLVRYHTRRFPAFFVQQPDKRPLAPFLHPYLRKQHRQGIKCALCIGHGSLQVPGRVFLAVEKEIPDTQMSLFPQKSQSVIAAGIPLGRQIPPLVPVRGCLKSHGRRQLVRPGKPCGGFGHGLYPDPAVFQQLLHHAGSFFSCGSIPGLIFSQRKLFSCPTWA